jgi:glycosyltransferase involved in cell wall biosynthesis
MKKKLTIWIIYQFASTPDLPGSERSYQFAKAFAQVGHQVTLWTSSFNHWGKVDKIKNDEPYIIEHNGKLKIIHVKTKPLYYSNNYKRFLNMVYFAHAILKISKTVAAPDIIIATYPSPFSAVAGYKLSVRYNAKFILEIRDLWPQVWVERKAFSRFHPFIVIMVALEKYLYKRTHIFVTALPYVGEYLSVRGIKPDKIEWIPNGINLEDVKAAIEEDISCHEINNIIDFMKLEKKKGKMSAVYVGGIGVGNRVDCIIKAARMLRDKGENSISFCIVGEGHSKNELMKYVSDNKLDSVRFWPAIPKRAVPKVLIHADVGVLCLRDNPIYRYGVNLNKLYDYMAASLPVVFSGKVKNNIVEISRGGITVQPENPTEIANALNQMKSMNAEERIIMGKRGYNYIAEHYDVNNKLSKKYLDIINYYLI